MKCLGLVVLLVLGAGAEPPRGYQGEAPYEPAGYRPSIPFTLPARQRQQYQPPQVNYDSPQQQYGAPQQQYGSPQQQYGPPQQQFRPSQQQYQPPQQNYGAPQQFAGQSSQSQFGQPQQQYSPQEQYLPPPQQYGAPQQQFRPPQTEYGPPQPEYRPPEESTEPEAEITTEESTTESATEFEGQQLKDKENLDEDDEAEKQQGIYYIYHPSGLLQKILFMTSNDLKKMAYSAQFKYEDVAPIKDPIYTYDPQTLQLKKISA